MNLPSRLQPWESLAGKIGAELHLDPALVLAVMDRESGGGVYLTPPGPGGTGDAEVCEPGNCNQTKGHGGACPVWVDPPAPGPALDCCVPTWIASPGTWLPRWPPTTATPSTSPTPSPR